MFDRYVGVAGVVTGIIALVAPYRWHDVPTWATTVGLCVAAALIGLATGLTWGQKRLDAADPAAQNVSLFLQFSDDHSIPKEVRQENVLSWYALYTESVYLNFEDDAHNVLKRVAVPPRWSVFVLFKNPAHYRQMIASCSGPESMHCSVQFSNDRYAIVSVVGEVTRGTLEVTLIKN